MNDTSVTDPLKTLDGWSEVREPHTDDLLFRYDPVRDMIEIQRRKVKTLIDLRSYKAGTARRERDPAPAAVPN